MNKLPSGWQIKSLGEVARLIHGKGLSRELFKTDGMYPVFGSNGIIGYTDRYFSDEELLIIGRVGACGEVNQASGKKWITDNAIIVTPNENIDFFFLKYKLLSANLSSLKGGTSQPLITQTKLNAVQILLPPLPVQKQIAEILEKADQAKQKRKEANQLTEQFLQSAFIEMFGDPVKNHKGWDIKIVSDVCNNHDSKRVPLEGSVRKNRNGVYPYYGASGIIDHIDNFIYDYDAMLIAEDGANLISRATPIAFLAKGKYWVNNHAHILTPKSNMTFDFLTYFFNSTNLQPYITGSAQPKLTAKSLYNMQIPVPPFLLQQQFAELVQEVEALKEKQKQTEIELDNLFNSLMQKAFRGELV